MLLVCECVSVMIRATELDYLLTHFQSCYTPFVLVAGHRSNSLAGSQVESYTF